MRDGSLRILATKLRTGPLMCCCQNPFGFSAEPSADNSSSTKILWLPGLVEDTRSRSRSPAFRKGESTSTSATNWWFTEASRKRHDLLTQACPVLRRSGCFRPSDRLAGWDSHPLEIADFHGVLVSRRVSLFDELATRIWRSASKRASVCPQVPKTAKIRLLPDRQTLGPQRWYAGDDLTLGDS